MGIDISPYLIYYIIHEKWGKVNNKVVKRMSVVAWWVSPVAVLPIADLPIGAKAVGPVVPCLAACGYVNVTKALLALLDRRKDLGGEGIAGVCEKYNGVEL